MISFDQFFIRKMSSKWIFAKSWNNDLQRKCNDFYNLNKWFEDSCTEHKIHYRETDTEINGHIVNDACNVLRKYHVQYVQLCQ